VKAHARPSGTKADRARIIHRGGDELRIVGAAQR
jgi:hypothetical protein